MLQSAAAGDLHADNGHAFYIVAPDDLGELFGIVHAVELRAAHKGDVSLDKPLVKGGIGIRRAVRGDEQLGPIEKRRTHRYELDLHRPLGKAALRRRRGRLGAGRRLVPEGSHPRSGAAAVKTHPLLLHFLLLIGEHRLLIVSGGFALHEGDRAGGTGGQAVAQTVAVIVAHELRLAVYHSDGPLVARCGTRAAAVAFIPVDLNDPSFHFCALLVFYVWIVV